MDSEFGVFNENLKCFGPLISFFFLLGVGIELLSHVKFCSLLPIDI